MGKKGSEDQEDDVKNKNSRLKNKKAGTKKIPFLWSSQSKGAPKFLKKNCTACPENEKKVINKCLTDERAASRSSQLTRSPNNDTDLRKVKQENKVASHLNEMSLSTNCSSLYAALSVGDDSLTAKGRADDSPDESMVSSQVAERAVFNSIGRMFKIPPVRFQVALKPTQSPKHLQSCVRRLRLVEY